MAVTSLGALDGQSPSVNGATVVGDVLYLQSATATRPGLVNTSTQSFGGNKTFTGSISAANLSGTNTGDVSFTAAGSSPDAKGASLSGQAITLQPGDATHPGILSLLAQAFAGVKTFLDGLTVSKAILEAAASLADAATVLVDASLGNIYDVTLGGNRTIGNPSNAPAAGQTQKIVFRIKQDGTGSRTASWDTKYRFSTDVPSPTLTTTASKMDMVGFVYNQADDKWDCVAVNKGY